MQAFAALIGLYIPIGLLVGYALDQFLAWVEPRHLRLSVLALGVVALLGARDRLNVIDPNDRILAPADLRAFEWIRANTPPGARFLVDGFLIYDGRSAVGSDGGWWIPLLTGRANTMPPQYPLLTERPYDPQYNQSVVDLVSNLRQSGVTSTQGIALLCRAHVTHVYIGQAQGSIGLPPPQPMLSAAALEQSPAFDVIYRQDKVRVFALNQTACR